MSILNASRIRELIDSGKILGGKHDNIECISYVVCVAPIILSQAEGVANWEENNLPFNFVSGKKYILSTSEIFDMPLNLMATIHPCRSLSTFGLMMTAAGGVIQPGFYGSLSIECLFESSKCLPLEPGNPIAQIVFTELDRPVEVGYSGSCQGSQLGTPKPPTPKGKTR